jgi:uncharacterized protein with von Willebrand factor type A (vWA) domain
MPDIKRIMNLAGKYRRLARSCQQRRVVHGMDDTVGVRRGDQLPQAIGSELAMLALPELEDEVLQRMLEGQLIQYDRRSVEPVGKGPVFAFTDVSGSMGVNDNYYHALAIASTMSWIAKLQRRWSCLASFQTHLHKPHVFEPVKWSMDELMAYLSEGWGGGTSIEWLADIESMFVKTGAQRGKTDIILITDGLVEMSPQGERKFMAWKRQNQCRLITMLIACSEPASIARMSDLVFSLPKLGLGEAGVHAAFSI